MSDLHQEVTDKILALIEAGTPPWRCGWRQSTPSGMPANPFAGRSYNGINVVLLWAEAQAKGYESAHWATYRQIQAAGGQVRKGEKGTRIIFYRTLDIAGETADEEGKRIPILKSYSVFNVAQCDGLVTAEAPEPLSEPERDERVERFVANVGAEVRFNAGRAFYSPSEDYLGMPKRGLFHTAESFYATLIHETVHFSGHPSRLDRLKLTARYGSESYAVEELIAELGASFLCAELGINSDLPNHASYLASWLAVMKGDKRAIFKAAAAASQAAQFLKARQPVGGDKIEDVAVRGDVVTRTPPGETAHL